MAQTSTFIFDDDGIAYLYSGNQIVASSRNLEELEKLAAMGDIPGSMPPSMPPTPTSQAQAPCMQCGGAGCPACQTNAAGMAGAGTSMPGQPIMASHDHKEEREEEDDERTKTDERKPDDEQLPWEKATHVTTPNGIKGKIVGRAKGLWGDEVTIRLENGRIAKYDVVAGQNYTYENEDDPKWSNIQRLQSKLDEIPAMSRQALLQRIEDLKSIRKQASFLAVEASLPEVEALNEMVLTANHEMKVAVQTIEDIDRHGYEAPAPFTHSAVEQASRSRNDASWLGDVYTDIMKEAAGTDYDRLIDEAPETLVAEIPTPVLFDQEAVHNIANDFVTSKTVGLDPIAVNQFRQAFLNRVEAIRVKESSTRPDREQEVQTRETQKTAKRVEQELEGVSDEGLFL